jgi:hypothetical protein
MLDQNIRNNLKLKETASKTFSLLREMYVEGGRVTYKHCHKMASG